MEVVEDVAVIFIQGAIRMPTRQRQLNRTENAEHLKIRNQLKNLGIEVETGPVPEIKSRFCLEAIHADFARVHDLPDGSVAVSLPAKLTVYSNVMITDALVLPEWDDCSLDLAEPCEHRYFNQFSEDFPSYSPAILNELLVGRTHPVRTLPVQRLNHCDRLESSSPYVQR